jgi:hypothetical protein
MVDRLPSNSLILPLISERELLRMTDMGGPYGTVIITAADGKRLPYGFIVEQFELFS